MTLPAAGSLMDAEKKNCIETCITSYVKQISSPGSMHGTGCLGLMHWDDPEGWYREGGGRGVQDGERATSRRGTDTPMHCLEKTAGSTHSSPSGLRGCVGADLRLSRR